MEKRCRQQAPPLAAEHRLAIHGETTKQRLELGPGPGTFQGIEDGKSGNAEAYEQEHHEGQLQRRNVPRQIVDANPQGMEFSVGAEFISYGVCTGGAKVAGVRI